MKSLRSPWLVGLSAATLLSLSAGPAPATEGPARRATRSGRPARGHSPNYWRFGRSPKVSRHWHDPKDPLQASRIEAAKAKRTRKAAKLDRDINESAKWNFAHGDPVPGTIRAVALNPFYIAQ